VLPPFETHSAQARAIADLFTQTLIVCGIILLVVTFLVTYCVVRFREKDPKKEPVQTAGHTRLEITWTLIPVLIVAGLTLLTARTMASSDPPADREPDITVIGHQWWWEVRYRSGAVTANEIHMPVGRDVLVALESADVIHDFWVPQLGRKIDVTPGYPTHVWLEADAAGTYLGTCAEFCGAQHAWMRLLVVAQSPEEFAAWDQHEREPAPNPTDPEAAKGARLFVDMTCAQCHAIRRPGVTITQPNSGPDLTHVAERTTLGAGVLDNDEKNLWRWLKDPQGIKPGSHMPSVQLSDKKATDLVTYFETLR